MDANELIRRRRQATEAQSTEYELRRHREVENTHTGANAQIVGRNPATGEYQLQIGDVTVSVNNLTNSDYGANNTVQVYDTGSGRPGVTSNPSPPPERREDTQSSEDRTGTIAVLLDCLVDTESEKSCKDLQDVWALFAIVQYVKPGRVLVMFSFPKETNNPVPYAKPRWTFGRSTGGKYACTPSPNPNASYESYGACSAANKVTCPNDPYWPPNLPLTAPFDSPDGGEIIQEVPRWTGGAFVQTGYVSQDTWLNVDQGLPVYIYEYISPISGEPRIDATWSRPYYNEYGELQPAKVSYLGEFVRRIATTSWDVPFRLKPNAKCGDTITLNVLVFAKLQGGGVTYRSPDGESYSIQPSRQLSYRIYNETQTYKKTSDYLQWERVGEDAPSGCGGYSPPSPPDVLPPPPDPLPPPPPSQCDPEKGEPSTVAREFWVGGHIQSPKKLLAINAEEEYEWFGSLMPDGYYVTIKWGRELSDGIERWAKVQSFRTTNLTDWRPVQYHTSYDLVSVDFDDRLSTTINKDSKGEYSINPSQTVSGAGGQSKSLSRELLTRPEGAYSSTINATIQVTPTDENTVNRPAPIYRIDSVLPSELNTIVSGCIEVEGVDLMYSPLFFL